MTREERTTNGALTIGETLAYQTGSYVVRLQHVRTDTFSVTVENGGFRIDELCRTHATESDARLFAREVSKRLVDGASIAEVVDAIQPAAELITAVTAYAALAADVRDLSDAQRAAILAATDGHITRKQVGTVKTLYALANTEHLGELTRRGYTVTGIDLNARGKQIRAYLTADRPATLAA